MSDPASEKTVTDSATLHGWVDRVRQIELLTRQHADQLACIWPDLNHHLNSIQSLLVQGQGFAERLAATQATSGQLATRLSAVESLLPTPRQPGPSDWSDADRRRLEDRGLFVVGTARSGTTVLYETLNESSDVYLLGEAMFFEEAHRTNFADFHELRHDGYGNRKHKGHYLPRGLAAAENGFDLLRRLAERYRWVGEKVALGPCHVTERGRTAFEPFLRFHATHFFHSRYVLIVRRPVLSVASMARLWGQFAVPELLTTWAVGFRVGVELAFTFPNVLVLAHDSLNEGSAARLGEVLGLSLDIPSGRFDREFQRSAGAAESLPSRLVPHRSDLESLAELYDEWTAAFCPTTFRYINREPSREFSHRLCDRADELVEQFASLEEPGRRAG